MAESPYNLPSENSGLTPDDVAGMIQSQLGSFQGLANFRNYTGAQGDLVTKYPYETGQPVDIGDVVCKESDGRVYRSRATALSTQNSELTVNTTTTVSSPQVKNAKLLDISSTVKLWLRAVGAGGANVGAQASRIVVSPTSSSITSESRTELGASAANVSSIDGEKISSTSALAVYNSGDSATIRLYARVLSGLGSGVTANAAVALSGNGIHFDSILVTAKLSATTFIVFYQDSSNDIRAVPVTVSGTTPTWGTVATILSSGSVGYSPIAAATFESSSKDMVLAYRDTTNGQTYAASVNYNGSTFTVGTGIELGFTDSGFGAGMAYLAQLPSKTKMAAIYKSKPGNYDLDMSVLSLSGSTLIKGTEVSVKTNVATDPANVSISRISDYTYVIAYILSTTTYGFYLVEYDGTDLNLLGSEQSVTFTGLPVQQALFTYHSPTRLMMCAVSTANSNGFAKSIDLTTNYATVFGVSQASRSTSYTTFVVKRGNVSLYEGLTDGTKYYADLDGGLVTSAQGGTVPVGTAVSEDTLDVQL